MINIKENTINCLDTDHFDDDINNDFNQEIPKETPNNLTLRDLILFIRKFWKEW